MRKQQWTKNGKTTEEIHSMEADAKQGKNAKPCHFASLMDICHLKNSELEQKFQKYKSRVVKDDKGSSASQMTAAKVMDVIARLPGCSGQAADAVSAYTQVKMEDISTLLKIPESECPDIWIRLPKHTWPKSWSCMEDPVVPLERNLFGHPLAGLLWGGNLRKFYRNTVGKKFPNWECLLVHTVKKGYSYLCMDDIKLARKIFVSLHGPTIWKVTPRNA